MIRPGCIEVYADRAAWLAARRRVFCGLCGGSGVEPAERLCTRCGGTGGAAAWAYRIGASDIGRILGVSPHGGPWDTWIDKMGLGAPEPDTLDMAQGRRWEARVLEDYAEATGGQVLSPTSDSPPAVRKGVPHGESVLRHEPCGGVIVRHGEHPWATCSPDGFAAARIPLESGGFTWGPWGGVECKAVMDPGSAAEWDEDRSGLIITPGWEGAWPAPRHYVLQCYWSLAVSGLQAWDLAAILMPRRGRLVYFTLLADEELQGRLLAQVGAWRQRHLVEGVEPPVDDSEAAWSYYASRPHEAPLREATPEEDALARALHAAQQMGKAAEAQEKRLRNELAARLQGCAGVALGPAVGRKKPPAVKWEGGGVQQRPAQPAKTINVAPHLRVRGLSTEEES